MELYAPGSSHHNKEVILCSHDPWRNVPALSTSPPPHREETLSQTGAIRLAKRLERYWHEQGYPAARFWAEPIGEKFAKVGTYDLYRVNCNLVNGLPPRYRDE